MKRSVNSVIFTVLLLAGSVFPVAAAELLVPGGTLVGLELSNDTVTVKESVTKEMLNALDAPGTTATYPTLTVTAYAVQEAGNATAADAWAKVTANANP